MCELCIYADDDSGDDESYVKRSYEFEVEQVRKGDDTELWVRAWDENGMEVEVSLKLTPGLAAAIVKELRHD